MQSCHRHSQALRTIVVSSPQHNLRKSTCAFLNGQGYETRSPDSCCLTSGRNSSQLVAIMTAYRLPVIAILSLILTSQLFSIDSKPEEAKAEGTMKGDTEQKPDEPATQSGSPSLNQQTGSKDSTTQEHLKFQRRVLIMDFHGSQTKQELGYLQVSIPEAFIGPLQKTNSFELQSRDLATQFSLQRQNKVEPITDAEAIALGKSTQSEVVVFGSYLMLGDNLIIQAKAIDVMSGRVSVSDSVQTPVNAKLFDNINTLATKMSEAMANALPPLAERPLQPVEAKESKAEEAPEKTISSYQHTIFATFGLAFNTNLFSSNQTIAVPDNIPLNKFSGFAIGLAYWNKGLLPFGLMAGAEFTYNANSGTANVVGTGDVVLKSNETFGLRMLQTELLIGYSLMQFIPWKIMHLDLIAVGGIGAGHLNLTDTAAQSVMSGIYGMVPVGLMSVYEFAQIQFALGYRTGLILLPDSHMHLGHRIDVKVGYRL